VKCGFQVTQVDSQGGYEVITLMSLQTTTSRTGPPLTQNNADNKLAIQTKTADPEENKQAESAVQ